MKDKKKVLIITYYWPPSGGSGVQRWLKFVKYLPKNGWIPYVYTPENPSFNVKDESLLKDIPNEAIVIKRKIWEPYSLLNIFKSKNLKNSNVSMGSARNKSLKFKLAMWIRTNFFFPDPRLFWVKPSYKFLKKYIIEENISHIVTSGPPHSLHLIGKKLKTKFKNKITWITDFRDPWSQIYYKDDILMSTFIKKRLLKLEKKTIQQCDLLITVSNSLKKEFIELGADKNKAHVITNGYDNSDLSIEELKQEKENNKFTLTYVGTLPEFSNPEILWDVLKKLKESNFINEDNFELKFIGNINQIVKDCLTKNKLDSIVDFKGVIPHGEISKHFYSSNILLLLIPNTQNSKGILTGKLFEYLASKKQILAFGNPDGDVQKILDKTNSGKVFSYVQNSSNENNLINFIKSSFKIESELKKVNIVEIEKYSRENLTQELATLLN